MNIRKLSLLLILGGAAALAVSVVWFFAAYAETMDGMSQFGGDDLALKMLSCLYSSSAICEGAGLFSSGPSYSPAVFWIGAAALVAGAIIALSSNKPGSTNGASTSSASTTGAAPEAAAREDVILGFIPERKYAAAVYVLMLIGAAGGLLIVPLAIVGLAGFVLGVLGLVTFRPRLTALELSHLGAASAMFAATWVIMFLAMGTVLFLLGGLAQLALFCIGLNSYRHGRSLGVQNLMDEARLALRRQ